MTVCMESFFITAIRGRCDEAGFSLVEVLVAMAILSLSASVLLGSQIASVRIAREEAARAAALSVAEALDTLAISTGGKVCADDLAVQTGLSAKLVGSLCATATCQLNVCTVNVWDGRGAILLERLP